MTSLHKIIGALGFASLMVLSACAGRQANVGRVVISEGNSDLVFYDIGTTELQSEFFKDISKNRATSYIGIWKRPSTMFPQARIEYIKLPPRYHFPKTYTPTMYIEDLNFGEEITITPLAKGGTNGAIGLVSYQRFSAAVAKCVAFTRSWIKGGRATSETTAGNHMMAGHYCVSSVSDFPDSRIEDIIRSIGIKGLGVPEPSAAWRQARAQNSGNKAIETPITFSWPVFGDKIAGKFLRTEQGGNGRLWASPRSDIECTGTWWYVSGKLGTADLPQGEWSLLCNNGMAAKGTYAFNANQTVDGTGKDAEGNPIRFSFAEPG